jgi:hypothetical protein
MHSTAYTYISRPPELGPASGAGRLRLLPADGPRRGHRPPAAYFNCDARGALTLIHCRLCWVLSAICQHIHPHQYHINYYVLHGLHSMHTPAVTGCVHNAMVHIRSIQPAPVNQSDIVTHPQNPKSPVHQRDIVTHSQTPSHQSTNEMLSLTPRPQVTSQPTRCCHSLPDPKSPVNERDVVTHSQTPSHQSTN